MNTQLVLFLVCVVLALIVAYIAQLQRTISTLSINPNFNVLTRRGMEHAMERRRSSTHTAQAIITWDVAGMGKANQLHGEQWVNTRISTALASITLRKGECIIGQLNSGDEFLLVCPLMDAAHLATRIQTAFQDNALGEGEAIYLNWQEMDPTQDIAHNAASCMEGVYRIKALRKGL
jgi:flagellar biosynthesis protein FlhB